MEDDEYTGPPPSDVVCQRAQALRDLAASVDETANAQARKLLIEAMERVVGNLFNTNAKAAVRAVDFRGNPVE